MESAERLVVHDPLHEHGWRMLMRAYHEKGDRNHALLTYKRCCQVLHNELGIEPEVETTELRESIINGNLGNGTITPTVRISNDAPAVSPATVTSDNKHNILVLPFENQSSDPEQQYFSDGLTEGIIMGLSLFPALKVHSRHSSFAAADKKWSITKIGQEFQCLYVVEGSVRKSQGQVRISAHLVNTESGEQIWGKRFDNTVEETFSIEDAVTRAIVAAIKGKIDITDQDIAIRKPARDMQSYDLLMRGKYHVNQFNREDNQIGIDLLLQCLEKEPDNAIIHITIYQAYITDWLSGWHHPRPEILDKAGHHVSRAIELGADIALIQASFAEYLAFTESWDSADVHNNRALQLNPNDPETLATVAAVEASLGNVDKALELADACQTLDPFHPWIYWILGMAYYRGKRFDDALKAFKNMAIPIDEIDAWIAACYERLGKHDKASTHLKLYLDIARQNMARFPETLEEWETLLKASPSFRPGEGVDYHFEALCDAGLKVFVESSTNTGPTDELHSIAVLPFDNLSGDPDQEYFSDGITESIILNLTLFPALQVKSRNSSFAFKQQIKSLGEISKALAVDYIVEGSIRKSDDRVRITVQLIEAGDGNQVWGKRYDATIGDIFDLEEELSRSIAVTVTGRVESDLQRIAITNNATHQQSYDLLLGGMFHCYKFTREDTVIAIDKLERCLALDPENVRAHALLYCCHVLNWMERWVKDYEYAFQLAGECISKALQLDPEVGMVQMYYAMHMIFCRDYEAAAYHIEKALAMNPNDTDSLACKAFNLNAIGEFESALEIAKNCFHLDPYHPWVEWILAESQLYCGYPEDSIHTILNANTSQSYLRALLVVAYFKTGDEASARQAMKQFQQGNQDSMLSMPKTRDEWTVYWSDNLPYRDTQMTENMIECLMKAGLCDEVENKKSTVDSDRQNDSQEDLHSIAILPFDNLSGDPEQEYFSDGITESIILNLTLFPGLQVKSRNSSFAFKQQIKSLGEISKELAVDYIVEGSIRKAGDHIRITVQLIEADSGNQIWGNRYESNNDRLFELEEELSRQIAATVTSRIDSDLQRIAISKSATDQQSYDLLLAGRYHCQKFTRQDTITALTYLQQCLEQDPHNVQAHSLLYACHTSNWMERWTKDYKESFRLAGEHSRKAFALDPDNIFAQWAYAEFLIFCRENDKAAILIDKALAINPNDPELLATKAFNLIATGEYESALESAKTCYRLDPYHFWVSWVMAESQMYSGQTEAAIDTMLNSKTEPGFIRALLVVAYLKTGEEEKARQAMKELLQAARDSMLAMPATPEEWIEYWKETAPYHDASIAEGIIEALVEAGLCDDISEVTEEIDKTQLPNIVVLPFDNLSGDPQQEYFSDGITESVILSLSSFKELTVKSRHSSFAFKGSNKSVREIGDELGVQYIVEGSVRHSPNKVRVTVQLVEANSGNQVWGKRYDTDLDQLFEIEEELSQTIAGTLYGRIGKQVKLSNYQKPAKNLKSYDYLMRGWYHAEKLNIKDTSISIEQLQKCIEIDPQNADAHSLIAAEYGVLLFENWTTDRPNTLHLAQQNIEKALELEPDNPTAHSFMSEYLLFRREFERSLYHAEKAIELNPTFPDGYSMKAVALATAHRYEEAVDLAERSLQLDPYHPYSGWNAGDVFRYAGELERAIQAYRSVPHTPPSVIAQIAACLVETGKIDAARAEMKVYHEMARQQMPDYPTTIAQWRQLWKENYNPQYSEDFEALFDSLLKAGLCDEIEDHSDDMPSIAVLPFENMSGDPEQEYFSDGINSDIISTLSRFRGIHVVARHSTLVYKERKASLEEIAAEQQVRYILEGNIRRSGNRVRVNAELIDSRTGENCWSESYDRDLDDIFAVQDEITQNITVAMKVHLSHGERALGHAIGTKNVKAWELCTRAAELEDSYIRDNINQARGLVKRALEIDPNYSFAWTTLGWMHWQAAYLAWTDSIDDCLDEADIAAQKALELDPESADAWLLTGTIEQLRGKPEEAIAACQKAISIAPGNAEAQALLAYALVHAGEIEKALPFHEASLRLAPICPNWYLLVGGSIYQRKGELPKAIEIFQQAIDVEPESPLARVFLMDACLEAGEIEKAIIIAAEIRALDNAFRISGIIRASTRSGNERVRFQSNLEKMGFKE
ncbi:MAG: tetratricopeptide repeat protein [Gammaproteobacteria bacterium]